MPEALPTIPRLFLGEALKRLRAESGRRIDDVAASIGKSRGRLINVFEGKGTLSTDELSQVLDFLGARPEQKRELLVLGAEARKRGARRPYTDLLPRSYERLADLETMATEIWNYEPGIIPGLVQIPEYIEALMTDADGIWWDSSKEERRNRISFRLERQRLIVDSKPPKALHFVITDTALRTQVGGPGVMRRQLEHLLHIMETRENTTVQVMSATTSHNPALGGGLAMLHFGAALRPVGFVSVAYGPSTYFDEPIDTDRMTRAFRRLADDLAATPDSSRSMIAYLATRGTVDEIRHGLVQE